MWNRTWSSRAGLRVTARRHIRAVAGAILVVAAAAAAPTIASAEPHPDANTEAQKLWSELVEFARAERCSGLPEDPPPLYIDDITALVDANYQASRTPYKFWAYGGLVEYFQVASYFSSRQDPDLRLHALDPVLPKVEHPLQWIGASLFTTAPLSPAPIPFQRSALPTDPSLEMDVAWRNAFRGQIALPFAHELGHACTSGTTPKIQEENADLFAVQFVQKYQSSLELLTEDINLSIAHMAFLGSLTDPQTAASSNPHMFGIDRYDALAANLKTSRPYLFRNLLWSTISDALGCIKEAKNVDERRRWFARTLQVTCRNRNAAFGAPLLDSVIKNIPAPLAAVQMESIALVVGPSDAPPTAMASNGARAAGIPDLTDPGKGKFWFFVEQGDTIEFTLPADAKSAYTSRSTGSSETSLQTFLLDGAGVVR